MREEKKHGLVGDIIGFIILFPLILIVVVWERWRECDN